jgi:hypothetical protein
MTKQDDPIIDMTLDGTFVSPPQLPRPPFGARVMVWAIVAVMLAVAALILALTFWFVVLILPLVLGAALVAYVALRYQLWRAGRSFAVRRGRGER